MDIHRVEVGKFNPENLPPIKDEDKFEKFGNDEFEIAGFDEELDMEELHKMQERENNWVDIDEDDIDKEYA
jgi:hypothetical protein